MPNSQVSRSYTKTHFVGIIGLPSSGKSSICKRFAFPHPDIYKESNLFASNVVKGEVDWVYRGFVFRQIDDEFVKFQIFENNFFNNSKLFLYPKLTIEDAKKYSTIRFYEEKLQSCMGRFDDGPGIIINDVQPVEVECSGFVLVYDLNVDVFFGGNINLLCDVHNFLAHLIKLKKPVVLALSKFDKYNSFFINNTLRLNEFPKVPIVETSAHHNVNVEQLFVTLLKIIKCKEHHFKTLHLLYDVAVLKKKCELENAYKSFTRVLMNSQPEFITDWDKFMDRYSHQVDVVMYINIVGSDCARDKFCDFIDDYRQMKKQNLLNKLSEILMSIMPTLDIIYSK